MSSSLRIGIDLGGTKIAAIGLNVTGDTAGSAIVATPRNDYDATIDAIGGLVREIERQSGATGSIGIGIPGSISPISGLIQNANSTWLNGRRFDQDVQNHIGRAVRMANDANCFALSEAVDGAGVGASLLFGVILGTGCGGGIVFDGKILNGPRNIGGEWGHNSLPWPELEELPGPLCWCGRRGCMECWVSGPGMAADHKRSFGETLTAEQIATRAASQCDKACQTLERHASRLARGLAGVMNIIDPDAIILGGGLSNMTHLYDRLPGLIAPHLFGDCKDVKILPPAHGSASGVRGAAWLWN